MVLHMNRAKSCFEAVCVMNGMCRLLLAYSSYERSNALRGARFTPPPPRTII
ncbi:MAG: hypothetical protein LBB48_07355 [Treponema sp.]|nr:hypothetical protein [Treponema sp.]